MLTFARHLDVLKVDPMRTHRTIQFNANAAIHADCMNGRVVMMAVELPFRRRCSPAGFRRLLSNAWLARLSGQRAAFAQA
ncbi:hypothetical protein [Paraburkholderia sabiae]|jgi:hypothetical protein|uniref:hypothetical protein n=1 Tax=Paraburkholderia sabiae TaxID=273251 RepID=UPI001CC57B99|nr:hypothetical protein [Paraburkholderia sabiae]